MRSMKIFGVLAALVFAAASLSTAETLRPGDTVAMCGDSITEQKIYSAFIEDHLLMCEPVTLWDLLDNGTFGNDGTVTFDDLQAINYPQRFYMIRLP